jgi:uridine phosphorylase
MTSSRSRRAPAGEPGVLTASRLLDWRRQVRGRRPPRIPPRVILTHQSALFGTLAAGFRRKGVRGLMAEVCILPGTDARLAVAGNFGVGGPATAVVVEELAASGAQSIVAIDTATALGEGLRPGAVVLVTGAIGRDGTSRRYLSRTASISVSEELAGRVASSLADVDIPFYAGLVWSDDAPFRRTVSEIEKYRAEGAALVDMETAALLAAGRTAGIQTASLLVVADALVDGEWQPPSDMRRVQDELRRAATAVRSGLRRH